MAGIKYVFGTAGVNPERPLGSPDVLKKAFEILEKNGCKTIDTAALYGKSEEILGQVKVGDRFTVDTKMRSGFGGEGHASKDNVLKEAENSKQLLGTNVDVYYLHAPDPKTPIAETLEAINRVYKSGFFKRFGISNYQPEDVEKVYNHCKEKGYVLPTVFQGNYSAVARKQEDSLFPTLRKLGIAFYAYSPIAGGFLTKTKQDILDGKGRFDPSGMYAGLYSRPSLLEALAQWESIAKDEDVPKAELAYRWVTFNSPLKSEYGDAVIFGASSLEQVEQTVKYCVAGPLSSDAAKRIDQIWKSIEHEAPLDNYHK